MDKLQKEIKNTPELSLVEEFGKIVAGVVPDRRADKTRARAALVCDVKEFNLTTAENLKRKVYVVYLPYAFGQENKSQIANIVNAIQDKKKATAFVVNQRVIINKKSDFKQRIPRSRTLTSVYDSLLEDLLVPTYVIGKRTCIRLNGQSYYKIYVNDVHQEALKNRIDTIEKIYYQLTNRKTSIEFRPEQSFASIKKTREVKSSNRSKAPRKNAPRNN